MRILSSIASVSLVGATLAFSSPAHAFELSPILPADVDLQSCFVSQEEFNKEWINLDLPERAGNPLSGKTLGPYFNDKNGLTYVFPPNGAGLDTSLNCNFYKWSSQMFMWLTSVLSGTVPADSPDSVLTQEPDYPNADTAYVLTSEFMYRLTQNKKTLAVQDNISPEDSLSVRTTKIDDPLVDPETDSIAQAGTHGVLFTQLDTAASKDQSLVYYSIHTNRPFGYLKDAVDQDANSFKHYPRNQGEMCKLLASGIDNGFYTKRPKDADKFYNLYCGDRPYQDSKAPKEDVVPIASVELAVDYLSMALEVKASWVRADTLTTPNDYIVQYGYVPVYEKKGKELTPVIMDGTKKIYTEKVPLALIGLHIAGSAKNHSEMIWSTFEHVRAAPNADYQYTDANGQTQSRSDLEYFSKDHWLLSNGDTDQSVTQYAEFEKETGNITPKTNKSVKTPTNVIRLNPWGNVKESKDEKVIRENTRVIAANRSAITALNAAYGTTPVHDPRVNYILTGASWGAFNIFPEGKNPTVIAGTPAMANSSMETFDQHYDDLNPPTGCFSCHGIEKGGNKFGVSHIFRSIKFIEK